MSSTIILQVIIKPFVDMNKHHIKHIHPIKTLDFNVGSDKKLNTYNYFEMYLHYSFMKCCLLHLDIFA